MNASNICKAHLETFLDCFKEFKIIKRCRFLLRIARGKSVFYQTLVDINDKAEQKTSTIFFSSGVDHYFSLLTNRLVRRKAANSHGKITAQKDLSMRYTMIGRCLESCPPRDLEIIELQLKNDLSSYQGMDKFKAIIPLAISLVALLFSVMQPYIEKSLSFLTTVELESRMEAVLPVCILIYIGSVFAFYFLDAHSRNGIKPVTYLLEIINKHHSNNTPITEMQCDTSADK